MEFTWETLTAGSISSDPELSDQNRSAVHVEHFPGDEARLGSTQEQDGASDLFRLCHSAEWNGFEDDIASPGVVKGVSRHVRVHPAGRNAIDVNTIFRKLGGQSFDHADEGSFCGRIVSMKRFSALSGGGTDEHDVASGGAGPGLSFHLRYGMLDQSEHAIQVD